MQTGRYLLAIGLLVSVMACAELLGIEDAHLGPDAGGAADGGEADSVAPLACKDTQTDARNCGACGHDCLGGACTAGVCRPYVFLAAGNVGSDGRRFRGPVALAGESVLWLDEPASDSTRSELRACSARDCSHPAPLGRFAQLPPAAQGRFYYETIDGIASASLDGGAATEQTLTDAGSAGLLAVEPRTATVFYVVAVDGDVLLRSCVGPSCTRPRDVNARPGVPYELGVFDDERLYAGYLEEAMLTRISLDPAGPAPVTINVDIRPMSQANGKLVGLGGTGNSLSVCTLPDCAAARPLVIDQPAQIESVKTDGTYAYWTTRGNVVARCKIDDCRTIETLFEGTAKNFTPGLDLDGTSIVWTQADAIYRLRLP